MPKSRTPEPPERSIERFLISGLQLLGYLPVKTDAGIASRYTRQPTRSDVQRGFPDLIVCHPAKPAFFIEVKRSKGKVSEIQAFTHERLRGLGYNVYVVYGMDEVEQLLGVLGGNKTTQTNQGH
jgi:hypothetical protein